MFEALEKLRTSENGRILFYIFAGIALGLLLMLLAAPKKLTLFSNNGNDNSASFSPPKTSKE